MTVVIKFLDNAETVNQCILTLEDIVIIGSSESKMQNLVELIKQEFGAQHPNTNLQVKHKFSENKQPAKVSNNLVTIYCLDYQTLTVPKLQLISCFKNKLIFGSHNIRWQAGHYGSIEVTEIGKELINVLDGDEIINKAFLASLEPKSFLVLTSNKLGYIRRLC